ncbi:MAG: Gfo/Idh/MocA family oxidoreductase [Comamonadaceae bacterium]|nr:Gfo/Idh/MocA family oxidoreductase [Comamonadaceae bacterium]
MLADPAIDAVVIATPDHWHVPIGLAAVRAGKDVYIEKPLGHTLAQNKAMLEACWNDRPRLPIRHPAAQPGNACKRGVELVLNGYIGDLAAHRRLGAGRPGGGSLDGDPGAGRTRLRALHRSGAHEALHQRIGITRPPPPRYCADYALGFIAGWGAHPLDIAIWGMDCRHQGPIRLRGTGEFSTPRGSLTLVPRGTWKSPSPAASRRIS